MNIKKMVDDFQQIAKSNQNIQTVGLYLGNLSTLVNDNFTRMNLSIYGLHLLRTFNFLSEDMAKFVDNYPQYRKMHGNVSKHVTIVTEMSKIVEERKLMSVSQTEQELACYGGQGAAFEVSLNLNS